MLCRKFFWWWQLRIGFSVVAMLVLLEGPDLDQALAVCDVAGDELPIAEFVQEPLHLLDGNVDIVGENLRLHPGRPVFEATRSIGKDPETDEEEPCIPGAERQVIIDKEYRFDLPDTCHFIFLLWFSHCG
jgi:hypothetical protein